MPFRSQAQRRFLYAKHPRIAARFAKHTTRRQMKRLPAHVKRARGKKR